MQNSSFELFAVMSGLAYFALGLAVVARAGAYPEPDFRKRLGSFGAFGLLHAGAICLSLVGANPLPPDLQILFTAPSFLALYYFAFGWNAERPGLAHGVTLGTLAVLGIAIFGIADTAHLPLAVRCALALPASLCAAYTFLCDKTFLLDGHTSNFPRRSAAIGMAFYGFLQIAAAPGAIGIGAAFAGTEYEGLLTAASNTLLGCAVLGVLFAVLILLNRLDAARRLDAEMRVAESETSLARGEARLNRALGFAGVGCWEWDIADDTVHWSDQMYRIYGFAVQEFPATYSDLLERVHQDDLPAVEQAITRALNQGHPYEIDHRVVRSDGSVRYVRAHCEVDVTQSGTAARLIGTMSDITDLVESKNTAENAQSAAEAASVAKSNFMANMSHELRTPLNAIIGFSEILEKELFGPHSNPLYKNYATDIQKGGQRLLAVINDILTVSRFEAGNIDLEEEAAINVEELLKKCVRWAEEPAKNGEVILRSSIAPGLPALRGDPKLLVQAFLNLLSNAVKFTPKEGVVEIGVKENRLGGINVWISDTGIGMTEEQIARIGEPFLQFDDTRNRKFEGTGLGLRIAKQILELHTAKIEIQSEHGNGSTFSIELPPGRSVRQKSQRLRNWG